MKSFAKNKKGIELAINFLVTFILAIVIFGAGLALIRGMISNADSDLTTVQANLDEKIQSLSCSAKDKLCLSNNEATVSRGKMLTFGVHMNNYLKDEVTFTITIDTASAKGYYDDEEWGASEIAIAPLPVSQTVTVDPKEQAKKGFGMIVPKDAKVGQYFYKISVTSDNSDYASVSETLIFTVK